jgi:two-component system nitrate/nitrite response regulator NarL
MDSPESSSRPEWRPAESSAALRVVIADDHTIFRKGLRSVLEAEMGFTVVGEAADGEEAVELCRGLQPHLLLLDLAMPGQSGMDALAELATSPSPVPVRTILLTAGIQKDEIVKALQLGAAGVVLKSAPTDLLFKSIRSVMAGQHWIGREAVSDLVQALREQMADSTEKPARKREITSAVVSGLSNKEIARKLSLSEDTVKHHLTNIFDKMGASNRLELALFAVHHRLLE